MVGAGSAPVRVVPAALNSTAEDQLLLGLRLVEAVERRHGRRILRTEVLVDDQPELGRLVGDDLQLVRPQRGAPAVLREECVALIAGARNVERRDLDPAGT